MIDTKMIVQPYDKVIDQLVSLCEKDNASEMAEAMQKVLTERRQAVKGVIDYQQHLNTLHASMQMNWNTQNAETQRRLSELSVNERMNWDTQNAYMQMCRDKVMSDVAIAAVNNGHALACNSVGSMLLAAPQQWFLEGPR